MTMTQTVSSMSLILTGNATSRYTVGQHNNKCPSEVI